MLNNKKIKKLKSTNLEIEYQSDIISFLQEELLNIKKTEMYGSPFDFGQYYKLQCSFSINSEKSEITIKENKNTYPENVCTYSLVDSIIIVDRKPNIYTDWCIASIGIDCGFTSRIVFTTFDNHSINLLISYHNNYTRNITNSIEFQEFIKAKYFKYQLLATDVYEFFPNEKGFFSYIDSLDVLGEVYKYTSAIYMSKSDSFMNEGDISVSITSSGIRCIYPNSIKEIDNKHLCFIKIMENKNSKEFLEQILNQIRLYRVNHIYNCIHSVIVLYNSEAALSYIIVEMEHSKEGNSLFIRDSCLFKIQARRIGAILIPYDKSTLLLKNN